MKKIGSVLIALAVLMLLSGVALADCESDCDGPFQTCVKMCRQTTKEDSKEAASCMDNCFRGVGGCQRKCKEKDRKSENITGGKGDRLLLAANLSGHNSGAVQDASCIEKGLTCILNGTSCCAPYECKGKFPNTTCQ